jgi:outer membrane protein assembly factor BamB
MSQPLTRLLRSLSIGMLVCAAPVWAQQTDSSHIGDDSPAGVSVPDSPGATERLEKAKEKEDRKQWKAAAEFYQEALDQYARRVVPVKVDKDAGVYQYIGVAQRVQERLAKWPDDGINAYRAAYGQTAADLLASAKRDDEAALDKIFWTYFITDAGKTAGIRLMDLHLEAGRFAAAAWIGQRLLTLYPTLGPDRAKVLFRTALAENWSGDAAQASSLLTELQQKHANDTGSVGGKDVVLADALATALKAPAPKPTTQPSDADTWPSYGGPGGRGEISPSTAKPGAGLNSIALVPPDFKSVPQPQQRAQFQQMDAQGVAAGQAMGVMPAADEGALFFQDGRNLYAVGADSGLPLGGWLQTYGGDHAGRYSLDIFGRARGEQLTVTVTDQCVLAVMGQADLSGAIYGQMAAAQASTDRLVCLDRASGKVLWSRSPGDLPESAAALRSAEFNGTPRVIRNGPGGEDCVLVIARGGQGNQFEDGYVVCLSLKSGEYKWSTYVGSASRMFNGEPNGGSSDASELSVADHRVFVLNNLGTIAALDPYDGRMIWLNSYPRDAMNNPNFNPMFFRNRMNRNGQPAASKPWSHNPVVISGGKVFVLPSDGKHLLIYDAGTGAEIKRIVTADYDNMDVLLGVRGDWLVTTSDNGCFCIDWTKYDHDNPTDALIWKRDNFDDTLAGGPNSIAGRGFLTADSIFIPTRHRLYEIGFNRSGKLLSIFPAQGAWGLEEGSGGPGNVVVTSQNVIVAGSTRVDVYTDLALVRKRYEKQIADAPSDPQPRVRFAEVLFTGGQPDAALGKLDEAIGLIGGINAMRSGKDRDLIFTTAMTFARKDGQAQSKSAASSFFDRAGAAADSPAQKAAYRLARAQFDADQHDFAGAVKLCQEILSDEAMRTAEVSENTPGSAQAEAAIDEAIKADPSCYSAVEQAADQAFTTAKAANDPKQLLAVATVYPNAKAAGDARLAAAGLFEKSGDHAGAIESLRQSYAAAADPAVKARLLEATARNFLAMPDGIGPAIDRLARGARSASEPRLSQSLVLPGGVTLTGVSFTDAVEALRRIQGQTEAAALPDFHIAIPASPKERNPFVSPEPPVIANVTALVRPSDEFARKDRVVTWAAGGLSIYAVGQTTPLATVAGISEQPVGAAWANKQLAVWTSNQVWLLSDAGAVVWKTAIHDLPTLAVASDSNAITDEANEAEGEGVINGPGRFRQQIIIRNGQRFVIQGGAIRFIGAARGGVAVPVAIVAGGAPGVEQVMSVRPAGNRFIVATTTGRLLALDSGNGKIIWQTRLAEKPIDQILANPHFTVARLDDPAGSQIVVLDTPTGQLIGRRKFGAENMPNQLMNVALSEEGTLAYTLMNSLFVKDLYEPWKQPPTELTGKSSADAMSFSGMTQPDQLLARAGRVVSVYDGGKFVRVHDLAGSAEAGNPLATGANSADVALRLVGPRLFIINGRNLWQYNLADAGDHYDTTPIELDFPPRIRELFLGRDHAVLLDEPVDRGPSGSAFVRLLVHRRGPISATNPHEAQVIDYYPLIKDPAGILAWQPVEGGLYYLSGDQKLHWLEGTRK